MNSFTRRALLAGAAALVAGCGGGSKGSPAQDQQPIVVAAGADAVVLDWNAPASIDVLSNDTASRGSLTLSAVSGAAHGTASVANGKIGYIPTPGFYGTDKLVYTVSAADGSASAKAEVAVTVQAALTFNGVAGDGALSNAAVTGTIGGRAASTVSDATGNYKLTLRSTNPADFIVLDALGTGAHSSVKLTSLVGDVATVAKAADAQGAVSAAAMPALNVSPISTAFHALSLKLQAGKAPATAQQLQEAAARMDVEEQLRLATALRLTVDKGVALPAGISNTLLLAGDENAVSAVLDAATRLDRTLVTTTRMAINAQPLPAGPAFSLEGKGQRRVAYNQYAVQYNADGTGMLNTRFDQQDITWKADGTTVRVLFNLPAEYTYSAGELTINGQPTAWPITESVKGILIEQVVNGESVKLGDIGTLTWAEGPDAGKPAVGTDRTPMNVAARVSLSRNVDQPLPIAQSLTAPGTILAGIHSIQRPVALSFPATDMPVMAGAADVLEFVSDTQARFVFSGRTVSWGRSAQKDAIWIHDRTSTSPGIEWELSLLGTSAINGNQQWFAYNRDANFGFPVTVSVADQPRPLFTPQLAVKRWYEPLGSATWGQPKADGSVTIGSNVLSGYTAGTWQINAAGDLSLYFTGPNERGTLFRHMIPIKWVGNRLYYYQGYATKYLEQLN